MTSLLGCLVGVTWRDAQGDAARQMDREDIAASRSYVFTSYGVLVRDDRARTDTDDPVISVAHEWGEDGTYRGVTVIPCEMVIAVQDLGVGKPTMPAAVKQRRH